jgi:hypothetical protein
MDKLWPPPCPSFHVNGILTSPHLFLPLFCLIFFISYVATSVRMSVRPEITTSWAATEDTVAVCRAVDLLLKFIDTSQFQLRSDSSNILCTCTLTQTHTTLDRTPLDQWSARRRDLHLATHNTHNRQTSIPSVGFEPTIPANERPQTHVLDRTASGIGCLS